VPVFSPPLAFHEIRDVLLTIGLANLVTLPHGGFLVFPFHLFRAFVPDAPPGLLPVHGAKSLYFIGFHWVYPGLSRPFPTTPVFSFNSLRYSYTETEGSDEWGSLDGIPMKTILQEIRIPPM
jgi:hypothetical protein